MLKFLLKLSKRHFNRFVSIILAFYFTLSPLLTISVSEVFAADLVVNPGDSIQAVVDSASAGDTVIINPGSYVGNVVVNKSLTLKSASGAATVTVTGKISVTSSDVTVEDITITNPGQREAVVVGNSSNVVIKNNVITNVGGTSYNAKVQALYVYGDSSNVSITGNIISNVKSGTQSVNGIFIGDSTQTSLNEGFVVSGNTVTDISTLAAKGSYGILVNRGSSGMIISNNTFSNLVTTVTGSWTRGVGLEGNSLNASVTGNIFSNISSPLKPIGVYDSAGINFEANTYVSSVNVANNTFTNVISNIQMHPSISTGTVLDVRGKGNVWSVANQNNLDQIESVLAHNCIDSTFAKGACTPGEGSPVVYGIIRYADAPTTPTIISPDAEDAFNAIPILNDWTDSTSNHGISKYIVEYDYDDGHSFSGGPYRETTVSQRNHIPDTSEEGGVSFRVRAVDNYGNQGGWSEWRHYYYDITNASSSFASPVNDAKYNSPIALSGTSLDEVGVSLVTLSYKLSSADDLPGNWTKIVDLSNPTEDSPFNWTYDWTPSADGVYDLKVSATDKAGNVENTGYVFNITYDATAPAVPSLVSPANGAYIKPADAWLDWTDVTDTNGPVTYKYKSSWTGGSYGPVSTGTASIINATASASRTYNWQVQACDALGNCSAWSGPWTVTIDGTIPTKPVWTNTHALTQNGDLTHTGSLVRKEMKFTESYDQFGLNNYEYQFVRYDLNGVKLQSGSVNMNSYLGGVSCSSGECVWKPDMQDNSQWIFRMRAIDKAGNKSAWSNWNDASDSQFYNFSFDYNDYLSNTGVFARSDYDGSTPGNRSFVVRENVNPTSSITTADFDTNNPNIVINYTSSDGGTSVKNVKLFDSSDNLLATSTTGSFNYAITGGDGEYCFYTLAEDIADDGLLDGAMGNVQSTPSDKCDLKVTLDETAPAVGEVKFMMDFNPYLRGNGFIAHANVSDGFSGINGSTCEFTFDGGSTWEVGSYVGGKCTIAKSTPDNTLLNVNVKVSDNFGNVGMGVAKLRTSDRLDPVSAVEIDSVYSGPNVYGTSTIKGTASDSASEVESLTLTIRRSSDGRYFNGSSFCMLCFLPNFRSVSTSTLPAWQYGGLPGGILSNGVTYTVTPYAVDSVLHASQGTSDAFTWDSTMPTDPTVFVADPLYVGNPTYTNDNTITVDWPEVGQVGGASDTLSGVAGYSVSFTSGATDTPDAVMDLNHDETVFTSSALSDGIWYFHIRTVDNVGNWTSTQHVGPFVVDVTSPTVTITSPSTGDWVNDFTVTGTASDATSGIQDINVEFRKYSDSSLVTTCNAVYSNPNWSLDVNGVSTCNVPDGRYRIYAVATDNAENTATASKSNIKVDTTGPNMGSMAFVADFNPYVRGEGFVVRVPVSESYSESNARSGLNTSSCKFSYDNGATWENGTYMMLIGCMDTKSASDGQVLNVIAKVTDMLGNESVSSVYSRTADREDPTITVDIVNDYYSSSTFGSETIKGTSSDGVSGVDKVMLTVRRDSDNRYWSGSTWTLLPIMLNVTNHSSDWATWSYDGTAIPFADGVKYTVKAFAIDNTLHEEHASDSFTWDSYIEVPTLISPADGSFIQSPAATLAWNSVVDINGPVAYTVILNGVEEPSSTYTTSFDGTSLPEGTYEWAVKACDILNNCENSEIWTVVIDNTAPTNPDPFTSVPVINAPSQGNAITVDWTPLVVPTVLPSVTTGSATDNLSGVDGFSYIFSQNVVDNPDEVIDLEETVSSVSTSSLVDGDWYFHLRTVDRAGNWSSVVSYGPIILDNEKPIITLNGNQTVTITVGDDYNDEGAAATDNQDGDITSEIIVSSNVNENIVGSYEVTYNVSDSAGNAADSVTRTVNVNAAPVLPAIQGAQDETLNEEEEEGDDANENDDNGEVLGLSCDVKQDVSGYVFHDKNGNGKKDSKEKVFEGVEIELVYTDEDGKRVVVETVKTDSKGKWTVELCPADYEVVVVKNSLPDDYKLDDSVKGISVKAGSDISNVNIGLEKDSASFDWRWLLLLLIIVIVIGGIYVYIRNRKNNEIE
ncbi:MAG TPA: DUF5011 domain-containing protein [Candidatus Dojkabacteria bacterium]|nr:DUF5011 domain-containing protein [Candidatus Dojkabacteria bacterium]